MTRAAQRALTAASPEAVLGLGANWRQFSLLVVINAFVGAMIGLERSVMPLLAESEFGLAQHAAALSFIATFGLVKAFANYFAGHLSDHWGRKRVLVAGWLAALPVPFLVIFAPSWSWIIVANVFLGINQGLAWSMTVIMKIDLVGPKGRGLAMGLNEFAGYLAVAMSAFATGWIAHRYGLRPEPFYLGIGFVAIGLALSVFLVRDTGRHVQAESRVSQSSNESSRQVFALVSWRDPALSSVSQAGLVNNLNDGLAWGLFPILFARSGLSIMQIGFLAFVYPAVWGILQLITGAASDRYGRKPFIVGGMFMQGAALAILTIVNGIVPWAFTLTLLGAGTAMVYPTLLAAIGDASQPSWRGRAVGVYRFWRDAGYVAGALIAGLLADRFGMRAAINAVAALTVLSGFWVMVQMPERVDTSVN